MLDLYRHDFLRIPVYCGDAVKSHLPKTGTFEVDGYYYTHCYKDSLFEELVLVDSCVDAEQLTEFEFYQNIPKNLKIRTFGGGGSIGIQLDDYQNGFYDFVGKTVHVYWLNYSVYFTFDTGRVNIKYRKLDIDITKDTTEVIHISYIDVVLKAIRLFNIGIYKVVEG
jgi:hypothetical protein